jgi:hypothetical protein
MAGHRAKLYLSMSVHKIAKSDYQLLKRTYGRWELKDGEGKPKIETCGGE